MPKYKVLSPVKADGEIVKDGEVELAAKHGDPLCDGVHLERKDGKDPNAADEDDGGKSDKADKKGKK